MSSNVENRSGLKKGKAALKLSKRQASLERQSQARDVVVEELRSKIEESTEPEMWIDGHLQRVIKKLVQSLIDAENQLYSLQNRRERLQSSKRDGKVPSGLKIKNIIAKGSNPQALQEKFDAIIKEAESKLLDTTIESLQEEEQLANERCKKEKEKISTTIDSWRKSFKASDSSLDIEAEEYVKLAKSFADNFYFQCAATRTSKRVADNLKKTSKDAKRVERMETTFNVTEQSIKDRVQQTVQQQMSKFPVTRGKPKVRKNNWSRSISRNRQQQRPNQPQGRRSRSKQKSQPTRNHVSFSNKRSPSASRRQQSKNRKGHVTGVVK